MDTSGHPKFRLQKNIDIGMNMDILSRIFKKILYHKINLNPLKIISEIKEIIILEIS